MLQDNFLFDGTLAQNIAYAKPHASRDEIVAVARIAHCDEFIQEFEQKYDTIVGERGHKLSGGERQRLAIARVLLKKGCIVPEHSHHNEQLTYILDGALKFWIDGREIVVHSGEVLCIPANMPHKAEALEDTVDLDVFSPPRADWINKSDQYLRGTK